MLPVVHFVAHKGGCVYEPLGVVELSACDQRHALVKAFGEVLYGEDWPGILKGTRRQVEVAGVMAIRTTQTVAAWALKGCRQLCCRLVFAVRAV